MRVITANLNGIRAAARKGFFAWLASQNADAVCIQETKAQREQLTDAQFHPEGYQCYYNDAEKKGYSGVALYLKKAPLAVSDSFGWALADNEGRYLRADYENFSVVSLYLPSGTSGDERQQIKYAFLDQFMTHLIELKQQGRELLIAGDFNIAHQKIDIKNWRGNQKNSGFLPEERAWLDKLFSQQVGYVDAFRLIEPGEDNFTWWSNRGQAYANNVGWRIDYQVVTPELADCVKRVEIYKQQRFSDHAPLIMDYDFDLR